MSTKELTNLKDIIKLLHCIQQKPKSRYKDIAENMGISLSSVKRMKNKVQSLGVVIQNLGTTRNPRYEITSWGIINKEEVTNYKTPDVNKTSTENQYALI